MQKLRHTLGLPVLETKTGTEIGEVTEILVDVQGAVLLGLIVTSGQIVGEDGFIAFTDVFSLGRDAIMLGSQGHMCTLEALPGMAGGYPSRELFDKEIFTDSGLRLGILVDIIFNTSTGEIKWYQVSDSIIGDLLYGRFVMPLPQVQIIGKDKIIVPEIMSKLLHKDTEHNDIQSQP